MGDSRSRSNCRALLRFYAFALPHWRWVLLGFVGLLIYPLASVNALMLIGPTVKAFQRGEVSARAGGEAVAAAVEEVYSSVVGQRF